MILDFSQNSSLAEILHAACVRNRSRTALVEADRDAETARLTYGDVLREGERLARVMIERGLKPGDRCVILLPNQSKWIVTALAVFWAGGVVVPIDVKLKPEEQTVLIDFAEPTMVVSETSLWKAVEAVSKQNLSSLPVFLVDGAAPDASHLRWDTPSSEGASTFSLPVRRERRDIASVVFTSGTGGDPKGCLLSNEAYLTNMESLIRAFPAGPEDRYLSIIPSNHVIDFMCGFLIPVSTGSMVVHQRTVRSEFIVGTMKKYKITFMAVVPLLLKAIQQGIVENRNRMSPFKRRLSGALVALNAALTRNRPRFWLSRRLLKPLHDRFGGHLARLIVGGSFVDKEMADFFFRRGIGVSIGYGMTEVCTAIALNDLNPYRGDTVGPILWRGEVQIRNAGENGIGEIWIRGPFLMSGYFKNQRLTDETIVDGWLRSGDMGRVDATGHLILTGRSKNMIVTEGGKNVYPEDVEQAFRNISECDEYCVFACHYVWPSHDARKDALIMILRPKQNEDVPPDFAEKLKMANRQLDIHKRISGYLLWSEPFPRTASLKIKRERLASAIRDVGTHSRHIVPL